MSRAAQVLSISQSSVTEAIKELESDLGVELFERLFAPLERELFFKKITCVGAAFGRLFIVGEFREGAIGGIYGTISAIRDDTVTLSVGTSDTPMVIARWAIRNVEAVSVENEGEILACPWHGWEFDLTTGEMIADERIRLRKYPVEVRDGTVYVTL